MLEDAVNGVAPLPKLLLMQVEAIPLILLLHVLCCASLPTIIPDIPLLKADADHDMQLKRISLPLLPLLAWMPL